MTVDTDPIRSNLGQQRLAGAKARHRHSWVNIRETSLGRLDGTDPEPFAFETSAWTQCIGCGVRRDDARSKAGKNARSRGNRRELYVQRTYGPVKVGQHGDAIDNLGHSWKWQSKTTRLGSRKELPLWAAGIEALSWGGIKPYAWITVPMAKMDPLHRDLRPLLIRSWTFPVGSLDLLIVRSSDWAELHGLPVPAIAEHMAMTGRWFLEVNGLDR